MGYSIVLGAMSINEDAAATDGATASQTSSGSIHDYELQAFLGEGATAHVYLATHLKTQSRVAIKVIDKLLIHHARLESKVQREILLHTSLRHQHIVQVLDVFEDARNHYMVLEYCECQSVAELVREARHSAHAVVDEAVAKKIFRQTVLGVAYLHHNGIIHRDLKLSNLLLTSDMNVKVSDLGLATKISDEHGTICGTPNFIAPEVLLAADGGSGAYNEFADIWSLGCILYTLLLGAPPFQGRRVSETLANVSNAAAHPVEFPRGFSATAGDLIKRMLHADPSSRPSIEQIQLHPWLKITVNPDPNEIEWDDEESVQDCDSTSHSSPQKQIATTSAHFRRSLSHSRLSKHRKLGERSDSAARISKSLYPSRPIGKFGESDHPASFLFESDDHQDETESDGDHNVSSSDYNKSEDDDSDSSSHLADDDDEDDDNTVVGNTYIEGFSNMKLRGTDYEPKTTSMKAAPHFAEEESKDTGEEDIPEPHKEPLTAGNAAVSHSSIVNTRKSQSLASGDQCHTLSLRLQLSDLPFLDINNETKHTVVWDCWLPSTASHIANGSRFELSISNGFHAEYVPSKGDFHGIRADGTPIAYRFLREHGPSMKETHRQDRSVPSSDMTNILRFSHCLMARSLQLQRAARHSDVASQPMIHYDTFPESLLASLRHESLQVTVERQLATAAHTSVDESAIGESENSCTIVGVGTGQVDDDGCLHLAFYDGTALTLSASGTTLRFRPSLGDREDEFDVGTTPFLPSAVKQRFQHVPSFVRQLKGGRTRTGG